jgi:hypothetical protein
VIVLVGVVVLVMGLLLVLWCVRVVIAHFRPGCGGSRPLWLTR